MGFIARDYEKVFPQWVVTDQDGYKAISTSGLQALTVESIRQLKADNDGLRGRLAALETARRATSSIFGLLGGFGPLVVRRGLRGVPQAFVELTFRGWGSCEGAPLRRFGVGDGYAGQARSVSVPEVRAQYGAAFRVKMAMMTVRCGKCTTIHDASAS
jgi:hypothetical protein